MKILYELHKKIKICIRKYKIYKKNHWEYYKSQIIKHMLTQKIFKENTKEKKNVQVTYI